MCDYFVGLLVYSLAACCLTVSASGEPDRDSIVLFRNLSLSKSSYPPCNARSRSVSCTVTGQESKPLGCGEWFPSFHDFFHSRAFPGATVSFAGKSGNLPVGQLVSLAEIATHGVPRHADKGREALWLEGSKQFSHRPIQIWVHRMGCVPYRKGLRKTWRGSDGLFPLIIGRHTSEAPRHQSRVRTDAVNSRHQF